MTTIEQKLETLTGDFNDIKSKIAALLDEVKGGGAPLEEISTAVVEMADALGQISGAITKIKLPPAEVSVVVNPTPIQNNMPAPVVQILERVQPGSYKFEVEYDRHDRIVSALLTPVPSSPAARR